IPIQHSAEDLATDFGKVFGMKPRIVHRQEDAAPLTILIDEQSKLPESVRPIGSADPESFSISVAKADWNKAHATDVIVLSGADMRGTIFAIYEFSQQYLGVDPLYYWTDDEPQVKDAAQRGLIVTQHHAIPLGLNVARWPKDVAYNYTSSPEFLEQAWKNAVNSYLPDQEVLWSVGLRGLSDVTYASMDPTVRNNNRAL